MFKVGEKVFVCNVKGEKITYVTEYTEIGCPTDLVRHGTTELSKDCKDNGCTIKWVRKDGLLVMIEWCDNNGRRMCLGHPIKNLKPAKITNWREQFQ